MNTTTQQDTQAAANKAAEEGGLPAIGMKMARELLPKLTSLHSRLRNPSSIKINSEADSMAVGDASALCRKLIAADRASRQVANKAEVEPVAHLKFWARQSWSGNGNHDVEHAEGLEVCKAGEIGDDGEPAFPVFATPPATTGASTARDQAFEEAAAWHDAMNMNTSGSRAAYVHCQSAKAIRALKGSVGASTVLTDERIEKIWDEAFGFMDLPPAAYTFAREVAAQAGQVAGWMNPANGEVTSAANKKQMESAEFGQWKEIATRYTIPLLAPSPAKESK